MRAEELRDVLLVKAVEESDGAGTILTSAERAAASRTVRRENPGAHATDVLLALRAQRLLPRIVERHPVAGSLLSVTREPRWLAAVLVVVSLASGFALSALDGSRSINILGFPLLGLVAWNLAVYALLLFRPSFSGRWLAPGVARLARVAAQRSRQSGLSDALLKFVREWYQAAQPLYRLRAARMLHLAAVALGLGLIGGLYLRGLVLEYRATWASTFLAAPQVHALVSIVYGPASLATGVPIPGVADLEAIGSGGENAARWIHLMAGTVALFVILPRALLAAAASAGIARRSRELAPPASLQPYFRSTFAHSDGLGRAKVRVVPYAYEPSPAAAQRLRERLPALLGGELVIESEASTPYGEEDALLAQLEVGGGADVLVLLFSLAATPEDENHGVLMTGARELVARGGSRSGSLSGSNAELVVLVDEAPYAARLAGEGGARERLDERRALWQAFARAHGAEARFVDLATRSA
jgi:hypothetical protein